MENLKICFISPHQTAYSETFIQNLKNGLEGQVVHCFGGYMPKYSDDKKLGSDKIAYFEYRIRRKFGYKKFDLISFYFYKYLKKISPNVIIANYGTVGSLITPLAKKLNIPLIVHFHGYDASVRSVLETNKEGYINMFEYASIFIAVSNEMKNDLISLGANQDKIKILTCSPSNIFKDAYPSYNSNQILAVGRFVEKKAPYLTLLAFKKAKEVHNYLKLKMIGQGDLLPICQDLCIALKISDVEFVGVLKPDDVKAEMTNSFCFIQHSIQAVNGDKEGTPVSMLEALQVGLPVVGTYHGGIPDVVRNDFNGYLVKEKDVDGMAKYIICLASDRDLARKLGENAKSSALETFNSINYFRDWNNLITEVSNA